MLESAAKQLNLPSDNPTAAGNPAYHERISTALIDDPPLPMRQTFDAEALQELADSIKNVGLVEPLILERKGARFEVVAGHRRTVAAKMAGVLELRALVWQEGTVDVEATKNAENAFREDVNPVDEAVYFWALFEGSCNHDVDRVAARTKRTRQHVEGRIELLQGDELVLEELRAGRITIGVARELNRIADPLTRKIGMDWAIKGGATVRVMRDWRQDQERFLAAQQSPELPGATTDAAAIARVERVNVFTCACCKGEENPHEMVQIFVHQYCKRAVLDKILGDA
jgi:ParB family chromosome partitioning protein